MKRRVFIAVLLAGIACYAGSVGPAKGALVIVGGGAVGPEIVSRFVTLAGGPEARFVVIPTASGGDALDLTRVEKGFIERFGVKNVTVLHTRDPKQADTEEFAAPLKQASGVWIPGGRQWRLADAYLNTAVEREIKKLLERGGVVGGSSAGATIQGSYLVRGAAGADGKSDGDNRIMMATGHEVGFGLLTNSAIDQHVIARRRENDLAQVMAAHPHLLGIGIDESTAIVVRGERFEVIGKSKVLVWDGQANGDKGYIVLSPGQWYNLSKKSPENGPAGR
jgi:cyanophycinase